MPRTPPTSPPPPDPADATGTPRPVVGPSPLRRTRAEAIGHGLGLVGFWSSLAVAIGGVLAAISVMQSSQGCRSECYGYGFVAYFLLGIAGIGVFGAILSRIMINASRPTRRPPSP